MNFIDDIRTEELYSSSLERADIISRTQSIEIGSGDGVELYDGDYEGITNDEIYSTELNKSENRINNSSNLSWDDINEIDDIW